MPTAGKKNVFKAALESAGPGGAWTFLRVPFDVHAAYGTRARVSVKGSINGFSFRSSIFPDGDGGHTLMVNKAMQTGATAFAGDTVRVEMEPDTAPRTVKVPAELTKALGRNTAAKATFDKLSPSCKKEYVGWIEEAKRPETRAARIEKTVQYLAAGRKRVKE